jgi:hypothetical protein
MVRRTKQDVDPGWESSTRGDKAWKETTDRVDARNADARKTGRAERKEYEQMRADARRAEAAKRHAKLMARRRP